MSTETKSPGVLALEALYEKDLISAGACLSDNWQDAAAIIERETRPVVLIAQRDCLAKSLESAEKRCNELAAQCAEFERALRDSEAACGEAWSAQERAVKQSEELAKALEEMIGAVDFDAPFTKENSKKC